MNLNGTAQTSPGNAIQFLEPNGTYAYSVGPVGGYDASPASGSLVVNGQAVTTPVTFHPTYSVSFSESGLVAGTAWSVALNGTTRSSSGSAIQFSEPNGTYPFAVVTVPGYSATPSGGSVNVGGLAVTRTVQFRANPPATYAITFTETGLPQGTNWSVTLNGTIHSDVGPSIAFSVPNGSYPFRVGSLSGYSVAPSGGNATVRGSAVTEAVTFSAVAAGGPQRNTEPTVLGLPPAEGYGLVALAAAVAAILLFGLFGCPNECEPEGNKKGCEATIYLDMTSCGLSPDWKKDVKAGAEIIAEAAEIAKKLKIVGKAYGEILQNMPGWVDSTDALRKSQLGINAWATVVCRWKACRKVDCWRVWDQRIWVDEAKVSGPFRLTPQNATESTGTGDECFKSWLDREKLAAAINAALEANQDVKNAKAACVKECG